MARYSMLPARRAVLSALAVLVLTTTVAAPAAEARLFRFPILGAPFRAIGRVASFRRNSGFAFPILGAPFRAVGRLRGNSPFAFPILGAPFRLLGGGRVFATEAPPPDALARSVNGSLLP